MGRKMAGEMIVSRRKGFSLRRSCQRQLTDEV